MKQAYSDVRSLVAIVSTPLQYFNALELAEQLEPEIRQLIIAYPANTREKFVDLPGIGRWQHVQMLQAELGKGDAVHGRTGWGGQFWRFLQEVRNDLRVLLKLQHYAKTIASPDVVVIGRVGEFAQEYMATKLQGRSNLLVDDGATSVANLEGPASVVLGKKRAIRQRLYSPTGERLTIDGVYSAYEVSSDGSIPVYRNSYEYLREMRQQSSSVGRNSDTESIWMLGQPLRQYGLYNHDEYCKRISAIRDTYPVSTEFAYIPHPTETEVDVDNIRLKVGARIIRSSLPVEALLLSGDQAAPSRIATFYSGAYRSLSLIFGSSLPMDIFQMKRDYWEGPVSLHEQIDRIYASLRDIVRVEDRYFVEVGRAEWLEQE